MNSKSQRSFSTPARTALSGLPGILLQQRVSRRTMLGGLALLAGAGMAGCDLFSSQASTSPSAASTLPPTPTPRPTPTPIPVQGTTLYTYVRHEGRVNAVVWSPNGQRIASGSLEDTTVQIWDALTGENSVAHQFYADDGATVVWSPDGQRLASGDSNVKFGPDFVAIWDASTGEDLKMYDSHAQSPVEASVNGLSWSPDGSSLASASDDYTVHVWNVTNDSLRFLYRDPNGFLLTCVTWSPDSKYIAFGNDNNGDGEVRVQVWDVAAQSHVASGLGHTQPIESVAWSPDGKYIATGSIDKTVRVWHAPTASPVVTYSGHDNHQDLSSTVISVPGRPIAHASPQQARITPSRFGRR